MTTVAQDEAPSGEPAPGPKVVASKIRVQCWMDLFVRRIYYYRRESGEVLEFGIVFTTRAQWRPMPESADEAGWTELSIGPFVLAFKIEE
jgi:hypothetical protein